jgi:proteasome lid subunit RPN8/RPN11
VVFHPLAWLKLQFFCHAGQTEVGGFAISAEHDPLYIEQFLTVKQFTSPMTVRFDPAAIADHFDACHDAGLPPARVARVWCHTHPGDSPDPSCVDEETFATAFGSCDWSVMFILSRTGRTYARLNFVAGPRGSLLLPVAVDWDAWPRMVLERPAGLANLLEQWTVEFEQNVRPEDRWPRLADVATSPAQDEPGWAWGLSEELDELAELHMVGHQADEALAGSHELDVVGADAVSNRGSGKVVVQ